MTPRQRRWLKRLGLAFIIYTVVGFVVLPAVVKWQLRNRLTTMTHRSARVDTVRINPYALSFGIRGLALTEPDGSTFASFSNFYINFEALSSLLHWTWTFKAIQLGSPYGYVCVQTNGQFNFANLLTNAPATNTPRAASKAPPRVLVKSLVITNGAVALADFYRAVPFETKVEPIDVRLTNFTTRPHADSPYAFTASTRDGGFFNWAGKVGAVPAESSGMFEIGWIDLQKYTTYLREFTQLDLRDGKLQLAATYRLALDTNGLDLAVTNASLVITNLQLFAPEGTNALVSIPSMAVRGAAADLRKRAAKVSSVETIGGSILGRRARDGTLELLRLAAAPTNQPPSILHPPVTVTNKTTVVTVAAPSWSVLIENILAKDYAVRVSDEQPPTPASLSADQIELTVKGLSLASNAPVSVQFSARVNDGGTLRVNAEGTLLPVGIETDLDAEAIELRPFQPYVEQQQVKLAFTSGAVSTKGHAALARAGTNPPAIKFSGDVVLNNVAVMDEIAFQDFARWKQVAVRGIDFALAPMSVKVRELACDELVTSVVIDTNRQLTALAVLPPKTNAVATTAPPAPAPAPAGAAPKSPLPFPMQLDLLALTNASIQFADLSLQPNCRFSVQQFSGTVRGLSSALDAAADVDIRGRVNQNAPFSVTGKINPLARDLLVDLVVSNQNTDLTGFTPYMEKFAGYPLQKGKLTVGLKYRIRQQALEAENSVFIDQLTLGQHKDSPSATKLPVKLGVALLKDRNGRIELNVPVKGRLDDPKFAVAPIIWHVIENMLVKAATAPFALLGALVGGGEELSFVEFEPGQSTISPPEMAKIEKLGKALYERPALNLEITGCTDETLDPAALAWLKLEHELKSARMAELAGKPDAPSSADEVRLQPRDYKRLLKAFYKKTFNRDRPLPALATRAAEPTDRVPATAGRQEIRKGAEMLMVKPIEKPVAKATNTTAVAVSPRAATRPASLPAIDVDDEVLNDMESELHAQLAATPDNLRTLMAARARSVERALLLTQKVTAERLFILGARPGDAASKTRRVTLSLN